MSEAPPIFEIHESRTRRGVRVSVTGELDAATVPVLEARIAPLRTVGTAVRLDLAKLEFIDSAGVNLLVRMVRQARAQHWRLRVDPEVGPNVSYMLDLMRVERIVFGARGGGVR